MESHNEMIKQKYNLAFLSITIRSRFTYISVHISFIETEMKLALADDNIVSKYRWGTRTLLHKTGWRHFAIAP